MGFFEQAKDADMSKSSCCTSTEGDRKSLFVVHGKR
jgi:hypothetical protein